MPYFKDPAGTLHFLDDAKFIHLLPNGSTPVSTSEATALRAPALADEIAALIRQIDADADAIYTAALGNRATEYAEAEAQAQSYTDAAYTGAVPDYVQAWADATGNTAQWAADNILATATAWRTAQTAIRTKRLAHKEAARRAANFDALDLVKAGWTTAVQAIRAQLGIT